jgi:hypothetical protein
MVCLMGFMLGPPQISGPNMKFGKLWDIIQSAINVHFFIHSHFIISLGLQPLCEMNM